ncbi:uncharacterized protein LOC109725942 [Ananas comosus]|uniref:Uncharacterized protein LOC109725942 n=1 Tax=Ananas comosus TaxID=4615 RepID=A0A6P5GZ51_ANACO|nr:uncharacterized protein LOC109725942 [Ananas comosus]
MEHEEERVPATAAADTAASKTVQRDAGDHDAECGIKGREEAVAVFAVHRDSKQKKKEAEAKVEAEPKGLPHQQVVQPEDVYNEKLEQL